MSGSDDAIDSDINETTGQSDTVTITDSNITTVDGGIVPTYCLGDFVWDDTNANGIQDSGETGISDVNISLYDSDGNLLDVNTTDANGNYQFCGLVPDDYYIVLDTDTLPDNYTVTGQDSGSDDTVDSDINKSGESPVVTISDSNITDLDAGAYLEKFCLGDYIWEDTNMNGIQDDGESGIADVTITLNETNATTTTDENGSYEFCGLEAGDYSITGDKTTLPDGYVITAQNAGSDDAVDSDINETTGESDTVTITDSKVTTLDGGAYPTYCLGDFIWKDANANGIQDAGEAGVADVNVTLYDGDGNLIDVNTTDSNGNYQFCGLVPDDYYIVVDKDTLPEDYIITTQNVGDDDAVDSDINETTGQSDTVTITDSNITTVDGGIVPTYCLGDFVWDDTNANGIQDSGETGISDVNISLYDSEGNLLDINTTDANGNYQFCGLVPDDYYIVLDTDTLPDNYTVTGQDSGSDDTVDSDINKSGESPVVTISDSNITDLDAGAYLEKFCLGDYIWEDTI